MNLVVWLSGDEDPSSCSLVYRCSLDETLGFFPQISTSNVEESLGCLKWRESIAQSALHPLPNL